MKRSLSCSSSGNKKRKTRREAESRLPRLVVFDLDKTIWPHFIYEHFPQVTFKRGLESGIAYAVPKSVQTSSTRRTQIRVFADIVKILEELKQKNILIGISSASPSFAHARSALKALQIYKYFHPGLVVIQPSDAGKVDHFKKLVELHNSAMVEKPIKFKDILFFDDMWHNVAKVKKLGVHAVKVDEKQGVDYSLFTNSLSKYKEKILSSEMLHRYFFKVKPS